MLILTENSKNTADIFMAPLQLCSQLFSQRWETAIKKKFTHLKRIYDCED